MWTDRAASSGRAGHDLMPRLVADAEAARVRYATKLDLLARLTDHLRRLDHAGISYRPLD